MPGVILIDDEPAARRGLARMLVAHPDVVILGEADSVSAACDLLQTVQTPDAVFLDIEMPQASGFELIRKLAPHTRVIFVTAHSEHAPLAFEVAALDYLLKPVRTARLALALDRLRHARQEQTHPPSPPPQVLDPHDHLCLNSAGRTHIVPIGNILALQAEGDFTRFHLESHPSILMGYCLGKYESMLPRSVFVRISRSLIIHIKRIESFTTHSREDSRVHLTGMAEPLRLRRVAAARLKRLL